MVGQDSNLPGVCQDNAGDMGTFLIDGRKPEVDIETVAALERLEAAQLLDTELGQRADGVEAFGSECSTGPNNIV